MVRIAKQRNSLVRLNSFIVILVCALTFVAVFCFALLFSFLFLQDNCDMKGCRLQPALNTFSLQKYFINSSLIKINAITANGTAMTWTQAIVSMQSNPSFQDALTNSIAEAPFEGMYFECSPVSGKNSDTSGFEFILQDSPSLGSILEADSSAFENHLSRSSSQFLKFQNIGRDALLIGTFFISCLQTNNCS